MSVVAVAVKPSEYVTVEGDSGRYVPNKYVGHPIVPNYYCRGWNGKEGRMHYCRRRAGHGTDHLGSGRCKWHGGNVPVKHGLSRRFQFKTSSLRERFERLADDSAPTDIREEIAMLRALAEEAAEKEKPNAEAVARIVIEVTKAAERLHLMSTRAAISYDQLKKFMFGIDRMLEMRLKDQPELLARIKEDIYGIGL